MIYIHYTMLRSAFCVCKTGFLLKYYCSEQPHSLQPYKYTVPENTSINNLLSSLTRCLVVDEIHLHPMYCKMCFC